MLTYCKFYLNCVIVYCQSSRCKKGLDQGELQEFEICNLLKTLTKNSLFWSPVRALVETTRRRSFAKPVFSNIFPMQSINQLHFYSKDTLHSFLFARR